MEQKFFDKAGMFTDIHFGLKGDSREHNQQCVAFVSWVIQQCRGCGVDTAIFGGDWHDNRDRVGVGTLNYSKDALDLMYEADDINWWFILGNHDLYFRNNRSVHSLPFIDETRINLVREPRLVGDTLLVPWIVPEDDQSEIVRMARDARYVFGHFEFGGFMMNETSMQIYREGHLQAEDFSGPEKIFSGHFHKRQKKVVNGIDFWYVGNCFPHDFNDANDRDRGMMVIEHGGEPEFLAWPDQPTYDRLTMDQVLERVENDDLSALMRSRLQITDDVGLESEERQSVLDLLGEAGVPKATITSASAATEEEIEVRPSATVIEITVQYVTESAEVPDYVDRGEAVQILQEAA